MTTLRTSRFDQAGNVHGHLLHPVRDAQERHDDAGGVPFLDRADERGFLREDDLEVRVAGFVLGPDDGFELRGFVLPVVEIRRRNGNDGLRLAADGVGLVSARDGQELEIVLEFGVQEADEEPQGVRPLLVDVVAAVAAAAAGEADLHRPVALAQGLALEFEGGGGVDAAGAAHEELAFVLGIQVDEGFPFEEAGLQREGAVHAGFLGDREQALELAGGQVAAEEGEAGGDADAVVRAEGGVLRHHPAVLHLIGDRLGEEVEIEMRVLLAHHVLVGLENEDGHVFLAGGGFLDDHHVAGLVGPALEVALRGEFLQESGHRTFVSGLARNPGDVLENVQYGISGHMQACFVA